MRSFDEAEQRSKKSYVADCEKTQAPIPENEYNICSGGGQVSRPYSSEEIVGEMFKYHPPNEQTIPKYASINQAAKNFAEIVLSTCPPGADRAAAINCIRMARMTANAAIALNGLSLY